MSATHQQRTAELDQWCNCETDALQTPLFPRKSSVHSAHSMELGVWWVLEELEARVNSLVQVVLVRVSVPWEGSRAWWRVESPRVLSVWQRWKKKWGPHKKVGQQTWPNWLFRLLHPTTAKRALFKALGAFAVLWTLKSERRDVVFSQIILLFVATGSWISTST